MSELVELAERIEYYIAIGNYIQARLLQNEFSDTVERRIYRNMDD